MAKGSYTANEGSNKNNPRSKDTSYRSFICALLIFLAICLIILLVSINWKDKSQSNDGAYEALRNGNKTGIPKEKDEDPERTNDKAVFIDVETSTLLTKIVSKTTKSPKTTTSTTLSTRIVPRTTESPKTTPLTTLLTKIVPRTTESPTTTPSTTTTSRLTSTTTKYNESGLLGIKTEQTSSTLTTTDFVSTITPIENKETTTEAVIVSVNVSEINSILLTTTEKAINNGKSEADENSTTEDPDIKTSTLNISYISAEGGTEGRTEETTHKTTLKENTTDNKTEETTFAYSSTRNTKNFPEIIIGTETSVTTEKDKITTDVESETSVKIEETTTDSFSVKNNKKISEPVSITETYTTTEESTEKTTSIQINEETTFEYSSTTEKYVHLPETTIMTEESVTTETDEITSIITEKITAENSTTKNYETVSEQASVAEEFVTTETDEITTTEKDKEQNTRPMNITEVPRLKMIPTFKKSDPECRSSVCNDAASRILSLMNHSVVPCEDFYNFACGGVHHVREESADERYVDMLLTQLDNINNSSATYLRVFKEFFDSCVDYENDFNYRKRIEGVETLLKDVGTFQIKNKTPIDLTDLVLKLILRQSMPLFDVSVDLSTTSDLILQLTLPQQSFVKTRLKKWSALQLHNERCLKEQKMKMKSTYVNLNDIHKLYEECKNDYSSYLNSVENVIRELQFFKELTPEEKIATIKNIRMDIEFDILNNLNYSSSANISKKFVNKECKIQKIVDLQYNYPILDWKKLFETLTGHELSNHTLVQVYFGDYFASMSRFLSKTDPTKLNNAFLAIYANDLFVNTVVSKEKPNQELFCFDLSKKLLPDVWADISESLYSKQQQKSYNKTVTDVFKILKNNFCGSLQKVEWIDDDSSISILKKCNKLKLGLFTSPDKSALMENYNNLSITTNYQINLITLLTHYKQTIYSLEGRQISPEMIFSYFLDPLGTKSMTFYTNNLIAVPMGLITKAPNGLPDYLVMTRLGYNLARQIARHFDTTAMKYDINLTPSSEASYKNFIQTLNTMMNYISPRMFQNRNITFSSDGELSANERFVDSTAFRLILDSFNFNSNEGKKDLLPWISMKYSRENIVFITTAQEFCKKTSVLDFMEQIYESPHLPSVIRVENIISNSERFFKEFACPEGSGMELSNDKLQFPYVPVNDDYEGEDPNEGWVTNK